MPTSLADWVSFFRWLVSLWQVASESINAQESVSVAPRQPVQGSEQNTLGAALAIQQGRPEITATKELDLAAAGLVGPPAIPKSLDEISSFLQVFASRTPYPQPQHSSGITTLEGLHSDRGSAGACNVLGTTITRTQGTPFTASMVGNYIAIEYILYRVVSFTSASIIDIDTNIGVGATFFLYTAYPSVNYQRGSFFVELDRTLLYVSEDSTGVVDTSGTTVNWVSGDFFYPYWAKQSGAAAMVINGISYPIDHLASSSTQLILKTSAGVQSSVSYSVTGGKWKYIAGQYYDALSAIPDDIGPDDDGLLFFDTTYWHLLRWKWVGFSFQFAPGDPGSGFIVGQAGITLPAFFALCDGSVVTISVGDGTTTSITTPNMTGDVFLQGGSSGRQLATRATWEATAKTDDATSLLDSGARTEFEDTHVHNVDLTPYSAHYDAQAGADGIDYITPASFLSGPGSSHAHGITNANAPQLAHHHTLSDANAQLKKFSEADGGLPLRIGVTWYVRL